MHTSASAELARREWKLDGVEREALVYVPKTIKNAPIVFAFHGHGGTMQRSAQMFHYHDLWPEAVVVYPQGLNTPGHLTDPEGKKPGWQRQQGDQNDRDLKFFDAMLEDFKKAGINTKRVYSTGHSNGGAFTYLLWQARPTQLAAFAPSAALLPLRAQIGVAPQLDGSKTEKDPSKINRGPTNNPEIARRMEETIDATHAAIVSKSGNKPILHIAGENDELVKYEWQDFFLRRLRKAKGSGEGKPWKADSRCLVYRSKDGGDLLTYIHKGTHKFPDEVPELVVKFFKSVK